MRGLRTKIFKENAGDTESKSPHTTPSRILEVPMMGMIWQDEIRKDRKKREWWAFYAGCVVGAAILVFSYLFMTRLTGGVCS